MHEKGPRALGMSGGLRAWQGEGRVGANRTQPGAARPSNRKGDLTCACTECTFADVQSAEGGS